MIITYQGVESFRVQFGDYVLAFNPVSKDSKFKSTRFGADIALISVNNPDMNGTEQIGYGEKQPLIISGPGEYEVKGIFVRGFESETEYGKEKKINTIYTVLLEGMNITYLGALSNSTISPKVSSAIGDTDILFVPIGGDGVLNAVEAYKLAVKLEAKIIIPMHYGSLGDKDALKIFCKEGSSDGLKPVDKLTLKKKDFEGKNGDIVIFEENK